MANVNSPFGLKPVRHVNGAPWNGATIKCYIPSTDSTAVYVGDAVKSAGSGDTAGTYATVAQAAAGDTPLGVVIGFVPDPTDLTLTYRKASTARYCYVAGIGDDLIYEAQEDSVGGALAATNIGNNISIVVGSGSTVSGLSGMQLDSSTAATTNTLVLRLMGIVDRSDNAIGNNAKWLVRFNLSEFRGTTGI